MDYAAPSTPDRCAESDRRLAREGLAPRAFGPRGDPARRGATLVDVKEIPVFARQGRSAMELMYVDE